MTPSFFRWLRAKLDETRLHIPVETSYVGYGPGAGLIATTDHPSAMLVRRVVLRTSYEPSFTRRWRIGSMTLDLNLELPRRWHLANCGEVELSAGEMRITMHPVPVAFFDANAPDMIRGVVTKDPMHIRVTVRGLAGLVRLFTGNRIMASVEGRVPSIGPRRLNGIELLRSIVEPAS